ncbi:3170b344-e5c7-4413-aaa2-2160c3b4befc [Sclerotinia trifoliorum]|uniref:3170b344-e5c7-4413-aaa2-2160c3b4befc n=1 Tax=Sclerotinia trifoliorum TaxID=28548 RepID=A0A8H2ZSM0_9HELO|nr:3170b344-e5c7-4413-aaa2-2160c3b4befc [Sclerotinia trifoliorum]
MGEKITEDQVANLLAILRTDGSVDAKVNQINNIKSSIKQHNVPEPCILSLFEALRIALSSQHAALVNAGFSTLNHLLTRLSRQEPKYIAKEAARTLPMINDKMGDQREKYRQLAAQCLTTFWKNAPMDVERIVKNAGLVGKNSRMKETSMNWIVQMHQEHGMPFKSFVTTLMELLEDADGMVRDTARNTVITLFQNAPNGAKSDLKKQLKNFNVRPAIVSAITSQLIQAGPPVVVEPERPDAPMRNPLASSASAMSISRPATPEVRVEQVEPAYVNTQRELEETFQEMQQWFQDKESEANWLKREQSCTKLRRLNAGNAPSDYHDAFLAGIKSLLDGILKAVNSLRTSLSKEGCSVVQEVARTAGPGLDPMVEILLQNLIKLCGGTKKISSQNGNATVDIIISGVTYNHRIMQHIWLACQDKNVQPRTYATSWLKTLLKKEAQHKSHVEHSGGLELIEKCLKKGLADANPGVRENMRSTYWTFAQIWPARAEIIIEDLEPTQKRLLENSSDNPNAPKKAAAAAVSTRPGLGFSKSTTGPPRPSLRETMLAQKKAQMASKNIPSRPGSAMSTFSPTRTVPTKSSSESAPTRPYLEANASRGGLSVAPMRPSKSKRPELAPRPATAGPYSVRRTNQASSEANASPSSSTTARPPRSKTPVATSSPQARRAPVPRPNTSHTSHPTQSNQPTQSTYTSPAKTVPAKVTTASPRLAASPHISSPVRTRTKSVPGLPLSSPTRADEDFTMVVPTITGLERIRSEKVSQVFESSDGEDIKAPVNQPMKVYEDPFSSTDDTTTPRPTVTASVLEEVPVNEDAMNLSRNSIGELDGEGIKNPPMSPDKLKQTTKLLDSGIAKIKGKTLDAHGFRKLQTMIRDNKAVWGDGRFPALVMGLFEYLEEPLTNLSPAKVQDVKAQILATIKVLYKNYREYFQPYTAKGFHSILVTRSCYDARTHIVSGLELLADELVTLANPKDTISTILNSLSDEEMTLEGCRKLSMGLHILKQTLDVKSEVELDDAEIDSILALAAKCLESKESGVRLDAVVLCVSTHARIGEARFWSGIGGRVSGDPKSLITYYIVKRQRELEMGN